MRAGRKVIKVETTNRAGTVVLRGTAEVDQPVTAYVFTGQGSQEKVRKRRASCAWRDRHADHRGPSPGGCEHTADQGMGMDLYASSAVARAIWDRADAHFVKNYGFSILEIVRNNPKEVPSKRLPRDTHAALLDSRTPPPGGSRSAWACSSRCTLAGPRARRSAESTRR